MQGKKDYQEKLFIKFQLSKAVPEDNFYRRLKEILDLSYIHKKTSKYYGKEGQKSIDTEVFFKLMLIGYLENINSDRKIIEQAQMRMDMLYYLGYDVDEKLPWHSTLSRTRKLIGKEVFLEIFRKILQMCVEKGMVCGKTQAVDSAYIKANASMESMVPREIVENSKRYYEEITENEEEGKKSKKDSKYNGSYVSTSDPEARVSRKPKKVAALNYLGAISVDTKKHVICGAIADFADKRDSETTENIIGQTIENLQGTNIRVEEVLADTNYSSGESYKYLEEQNITPYIPVVGGYIHEREGFKYLEEEDSYICEFGIKLPYKFTKRKRKNAKAKRKAYRSSPTDCRNCPKKSECCKNNNYKQIEDSIDKPYYRKAYERMNNTKGQEMIRLRASTVEPVLGTLLNFRRMKKVYTKGYDLANKHVLMAAMTYNLKKLMKFSTIKYTSNVMKNAALGLKSTISYFKQIFEALKVYSFSNMGYYSLHN